MGGDVRDLGGALEVCPVARFSKELTVLVLVSVLITVAYAVVTLVMIVVPLMVVVPRI